MSKDYLTRKERIASEMRQITTLAYKIHQETMKHKQRINWVTMISMLTGLEVALSNAQIQAIKAEKHGRPSYGDISRTKRRKRGM